MHALRVGVTADAVPQLLLGQRVLLAKNVRARLKGERTGTDVGDQVSDALLLKELGKEAGPVGLHGHACCLGDSADVLCLHATCAAR